MIMLMRKSEAGVNSGCVSCGRWLPCNVAWVTSNRTLESAILDFCDYCWAHLSEKGVKHCGGGCTTYTCMKDEMNYSGLQAIPRSPTKTGAKN